MIIIPDDAVLFPEDIATSDSDGAIRTAREWIQNNGGSKICGKWCILGEVMKTKLRPVGSLEEMPKAGTLPRRRIM